MLMMTQSRVVFFFLQRNILYHIKHMLQVISYIKLGNLVVTALQTKYSVQKVCTIYN